MAIQIPADAKVARLSNLTIIRVVKTLNDKLIEGKDGLVARAKKIMREKGVEFAQSDLVVAALRPPSGAKGFIPPSALFNKYLEGKLTHSQFLACVTVRKEPLEQFLPGAEIDAITVPYLDREPSLYTEFRDEPNIDDLATAIAGGLASLPIKPS